MAWQARHLAQANDASGAAGVECRSKRRRRRGVLRGFRSRAQLLCSGPRIQDVEPPAFRADSEERRGVAYDLVTG